MAQLYSIIKDRTMFNQKNALTTTLNELLNSSLPSSTMSMTTDPMRSLNTDLIETDEQYFMFVEMPGVDPNKMEVLVENGVLTVKGQSCFSDEYKSAYKGEQAQFLVKERSSQSFLRQYSLPFLHAESTVQAHYKNGLLELAISKKHASGHKKVDVKFC